MTRNLAIVRLGAIAGVTIAVVAACRTAAVAPGSAEGAALRAARISEPAVALVHGHWFNGTSFTDRTVYVVNGLFADLAPAHVDSTIDLRGGFVVPPFADAHNHNVEFVNIERTQALLTHYVRDGVFYDQNPDNLPRARGGLAGLVNVPGAIDVTWSNGGLTATGGHPTGLFLRNLGRGIFTAADGEGGMFWYVDRVADLDRKWDAIVAQKPDFIKTFLLHSEEYQKRRDDSAFFNWRGLDPVVLVAIVRRAHAAGLRVMTHVETAMDMHNALVAGVDEIGHIPGFRGDEDQRLRSADPYLITDADAALAARRRVPVITTLAGVTAYALNGPDSVLRRRLDTLAAANLRMLLRHSAPIAIGSDDYRNTSVPEAMYLHDLGVFTNAELLRIWSEATPRAIFPGRRIGRLQSGYEASFLVLAGDPTADFKNTTRIVLRMKQGRLLGDGR